MPNNIALFKQYVPLLDEVYKNASLTSVLDGNPELVRQGANANELIIPKMDMDGLGDYTRNSGYVDGDVTLTNETVICNFDRGRMFTVDAMDNIETAGIAFGQLSSEFIRTKVVPELDAFRLSTYAGKDGIGMGSKDITSGELAVSELATANDTMTEDEVPLENRFLFITPTIYGLIRDMDTTKSREIMKMFSSIIQVPQSRFVSAIEQLDGKTKTEGDDETKGGYRKAAEAKNMNFMIVHREAVIQFEKHVAPKVITPEENQTSDGWKFGYRNVGIADIYENKAAGIYAHMAAK